MEFVYLIIEHEDGAIENITVNCTGIVSYKGMFEEAMKAFEQKVDAAAAEEGTVWIKEMLFK